MHKLDFGMPTLIELKSLEECAALCKELNLQFLELNMNLPEYQADRIEVNTFTEIAKQYGIYYTIHLDENMNPCDFNDTVAAAYTNTTLQAIELAKQLHIPVLNMHLAKGVYFTLPANKVYLFDEYMDIYITKLKAFRDQCDKAIGDANIKICIENTDGFDKTFLHHGLHLLLESRVFALTFDIGHTAGNNSNDEAVIMQHNNKLFHMHMHDARGKNHHLPLGSGELDLVKYLDLAKAYNCRTVIETKTVTGLKESLYWLRQTTLIKQKNESDESR